MLFIYMMLFVIKYSFELSTGDYIFKSSFPFTIDGDAIISFSKGHYANFPFLR